MNKETLERIVSFIPAYDKRHSDPGKNYGIHGVEIRFVLKGDRGAVQFVLYTDWHLPHVQKEHFDKVAVEPYFILKPMGADIGYHSPRPTYDGQPDMGECPYLNGKPCYYDGSGLQADEFIPTFLAAGSDGVWKMLEEIYNAIFGEDNAHE